MILLGIKYEINFKKFRRGTSFFIPCLDHINTKTEIRKTLKNNGLRKYKMKVTVEEGIKGVRVWKL